MRHIRRSALSLLLSALVVSSLAHRSTSPGSSSWKGCVLLETSNIGAPPETLKSSFGWRGDARIHGMSSLSVGSLPSISDFLGACGEIVVIIPKGARVTSLADLHSWSETCLTAADAFLNTFGGCSLLTPQFMQEKVLSHGDETPNVHVLPVFVGPAAIVATSLLHLVIGGVRGGTLPPSTPIHAALSSVCQREKCKVLYPDLPPGEDLILTQQQQWAGCPVTIGALHAHARPGQVNLLNWTLPYSISETEKKHLETVVAPAELTRISSKVTVVIPTFKRESAFITAAIHYSNLPGVLEVIGIWNDVSEDPPFESATGTLDGTAIVAPIRIVRAARNSLHNRFQTPDVLGIRSLGALSVDDDLMIDGKTLSRAIRVWRAYPTRLVGFDFTARGIRRVDTIPFDALPEDLPPNASHAYIHSKAVCDHLRTNATIALTGAAVFHTGWMSVYSDPSHQWGKGTEAIAAAFNASWSDVEERFNGEDMLFNFLVASLSREGPIIIPDATYGSAAMRALGGDGLHSRAGHYGERHLLASLLTQRFGEGALRRHATPVFSKGDVMCLLDPSPPVPPGQLCVHDLSTYVATTSGWVWLSLAACVCMCGALTRVCVSRFKRVKRVWSTYTTAIAASLSGKEHPV